MKIKKIMILILAIVFSILISTSAFATDNSGHTPSNSRIFVCLCLIWMAIAVISFILGYVLCFVCKKHRKKRREPCYRGDDRR